MAWLPRAGLPPSPIPSRLSLFQRIKILLLTLFLLSFVFAFFASFSLVLLYVPKPETENWTFRGIKCATCAELVRHNPGAGESIGCRGKVDGVVYGGIERCWVLQWGKDEWLRSTGEGSWAG